MKTLVIESFSGSDRWINIPPATCGIAHGPRHGICALQSTLSDAQSFVAAIALYHAGETHPVIAISQIDDPLVIRDSVGVMEKAMKASLLSSILKFRKPPEVVSCKAVAFAVHEEHCKAFHNAVRQTMHCVRNIQCEKTMLPPYSKMAPSRIVYDLAHDQWFAGVALPAAQQCRMLPSHEQRIQRHQSLEKGRLSKTTQLRTWAGARFAGADVNEACMNFVGTDYKRGPVIKAFDLRVSCLAGYQL